MIYLYDNTVAYAQHMFCTFHLTCACLSVQLYFRVRSPFGNENMPIDDFAMSIKESSIIELASETTSTGMNMLLARMNIL